MTTPDLTDLIEKLGAFYLGQRTTDQSPVLLDSRALTTHGVCIGMTGSGKTGMCISLLEEAAIDGIPAIVIDPKGDLANLALAFPNLSGADVRPYIDEGEAHRQNISGDALADKQAQQWRDGLAASGQSPARIARYREAAEVCVFTPGSSSGSPLSLMKSLRAPSAQRMADVDAMRQHITATAQALLSLCAIESDPVQGREHILLSKLLEHAAERGEDLALADLVRRVLKPPFAEVGVLDIESFYPEKERRTLAVAFNNLLASPGFAAWLQGEPLDIPSLLFSPTGKPRVSVISIAHLNDAERMFVVSLVLAELVGWMRQQPGTSSLRAMLFVDEVLGYLPPVKNPPSKALFMTLFKQARAFGLGVVVATQNPADLDYKALSNAGTWLIGRLQTDRDRQKVLDGIEGAAGGAIDRASLDKSIMTLAKRQFVLHSVHVAGGPQLFHSRCTLSYLAGPLTPVQLKLLRPAISSPVPNTGVAKVAATTSTDARMLKPTSGVAASHRAGALVRVAMSFTGTATGIKGIDHQEERLVAAVEDQRLMLDARRQSEPMPADPTSINMIGSQPIHLDDTTLRKRWQDDVASLPNTLPLLRSKTLGVVAKPGESVADFASRLRLVVREQNDGKRDALKKQYDKQYQSLSVKIEKAQAKVAALTTKAKSAQQDAMVATGTSILGALFGRAVGVRSMQRVATAVRRHGSASDKKEALQVAQDELTTLQAEQINLEQQLAADAGYAGGDIDVALEEVVLAAKTSKVISVESVWLPCDDAGKLMP
jgi:hypothetical protein